MEQQNNQESSSTPPIVNVSGGGSSGSGDEKDKDNLSIKSSDSVTTSGEYEIVPETPQLQLPNPETTPTNVVKKTIPLSPILNMAGDMKEMEKNLTEVIKELDVDEKDGEWHPCTLLSAASLFCP